VTIDWASDAGAGVIAGSHGWLLHRDAVVVWRITGVEFVNVLTFERTK
jgi:hypothetical protein